MIVQDCLFKTSNGRLITLANTERGFPLYIYRLSKSFFNNFTSRYQTHTYIYTIEHLHIYNVHIQINICKISWTNQIVPRSMSYQISLTYRSVTSWVILRYKHRSLISHYYNLRVHTTFYTYYFLYIDSYSCTYTMYNANIF